MTLTNIAYIKLPKQIVKKEEFFEIIKQFEKIEIQKHAIKGLKDNRVTKIRPYITIPASEYNKLFELLHEYKSNDNFISGLISTRFLNTLSHKHIIKLIENSEYHKFKLPFTKTTFEKFKLHGITE